MIPDIASTDLAWISAAQMREVDRVMIEDYSISLEQMMEHAGRHLAHLARVRFLAGDPRGKRVLVLAGTGGNGGGALVAARRLAGWGADIEILLSADDDRYAAVPRHQLAIARRLGLAVHTPDSRVTSSSDVILDGVIGYSLRGSPSGGAATLIELANRSTAPVVSLDVPSGLDPTAGVAHPPCVEASATLTLAMPKIGLRASTARRFVGELYLADIGVPPAAFEGAPQAFVRGDIVRVS